MMVVVPSLTPSDDREPPTVGRTIGRAIGATIVAVFCVALIWASIGHVDIIAFASGKIVRFDL